MQEVFQKKTATLQASSISRTFYEGQIAIEVLRGISFTVYSNEFIGLVGPSGCGKSTLLNILGLIEVPSSGSLELAGILTDGKSERILQAIRKKSIGYVFQAFNLLSTLTALENVMLPCLLVGESEEQARSRALALLSDLGLSHRAEMFPGTLSGGEMQRVAIARAIVHKPALVLADEPTGNFDSMNGTSVLSLLKDVHKSGIPIVMATHSDVAMSYCSRVLRMCDGTLVNE